MCMKAPFLTWEETKKRFPEHFYQDSTGEYVKVWKALHWTGARFLSIIYDSYWTPGEIHSSGRVSTKITEKEITNGEIHSGFHSCIGDKLPFLSRMESEYVFEATVKKEQFVACGLMSDVKTGEMNIVSTHLRIGFTAERIYFSFGLPGYYYPHSCIEKWIWNEGKLINLKTGVCK